MVVKSSKQQSSVCTPNPYAFGSLQGAITNLESEITLLKSANKALSVSQERVEGVVSAAKRREQPVRGLDVVYRCSDMVAQATYHATLYFSRRLARCPLAHLSLHSSQLTKTPS